MTDESVAAEFRRRRNRRYTVMVTTTLVTSLIAIPLMIALALKSPWGILFVFGILAAWGVCAFLVRRIWRCPACDAPLPGGNRVTRFCCSCGRQLE